MFSNIYLQFIFNFKEHANESYFKGHQSSNFSSFAFHNSKSFSNDFTILIGVD